MNELGNEPRKEYRQTYPKHFTCSGCGNERLLMLLQDEYSLTQPLCKKCLGEAPAALVDLIDRMDKYITLIEANRDTFKLMAGKMMESLTLFADICNNKDTGKIVIEMGILLDIENTKTKTLTRP